jgi:hypothetical protein
VTGLLGLVIVAFWEQTVALLGRNCAKKVTEKFGGNF